jgi:thymidine phosphorylase
MSKKLAEGLDALVLDVKFGSGAFMKTGELARELAESLVATGKRMNVATTALLTDMNQPLGRMAGNAVEVDESVAALEGRGPADLMEVTYALGAEALVSASNPPPSQGGARGGITDGEKLASARAQLEKTIASGQAREKFAEMVHAQGGNLEAPRPVSPASELPAPRAGYIASVDAELLGKAIIAMGGGRQQLSDKLDHSTGLEMLTRLGDRVDAGQPLVRIFAKPADAETVRPMLREAIQIADQSPQLGPLILDRIG